MNGRASSSSNSFNYQWTYDVFLNFRGEDTRHGFTGNLYNALRQRGIYAFMDDEELRKGDEITTTLLKAIQESRMAITIFSKNYASSTFCLEELVKILQCIKGKGRLVWPIFYDVDPSDMRHQKGKYEEALAMHRKSFKANEEKVQIWKSALHEAANMSGLHFNLGHEYEHNFIEKIVKEISTKINRTPLYIADYPIGLELRVQEINSLLRDHASNDTVNMVGICGIGGIGKTTVARAVYNSIADHFEGLCFLHDIKENSSKLGLQGMQERMLSKILGLDIKVDDVNEGIQIIKMRLNQKKILLILDNVDKAKQLEKLAGNCNWFGLGSRIIIMTRDKKLLTRHGVERIYEVNEFNAQESMELICWNAFKNNQVDSNYMEVLNCAIQYAQGLPLALEVLGSNLFGKTINEWKSALDMYRKIPNKDIQQILKLSYNSLEEVVQELFLDIACFFKGKKLKYVIDIAEHAHGFDPCYGIGVLVDNCIIKIKDSYIKMHDLIQDMGREIIRQESPNEPGERSRLWFYEDIIHVLQNNTGTYKIRAIVLDNRLEVIKIHWDGKAFKKMKNLKIFIIWKASFSKYPKYLPNNLRVLLQWPRYPASFLPVGFHPTRLGILDLQDSCLQSLPITRMDNMSVLNLRRCQFITLIPDVSSLPNLKELNLDYCENLIEVHHSVGYMEKLEILSVESCVQLRTFPCGIKLPYLRHLGLRGCISLEKFPEMLEQMEYIKKLDLSETNLELPYSIHNLTNLESVLMYDCGRILLPRRITLLPNLDWIEVERCGELGLSKQNEGQEGVSSIEWLNVKFVFLTRCGFSDEVLSIYLPYFANVQILDLSHNSFMILPVCIKEFRFLKYLNLEHCTCLREIRGIPPNMTELWATNCISLSWESKRILLCQELLDSTEFEKLSMPRERVPEWFDHSNRGSCISFWFHGKLPLISVCQIIQMDKLMNVKWYIAIHVKINGRRLRLRWHRLRGLESMETAHMYVIGQPLKDFETQVFRESEWNHVELYSDYEYSWRDTKEMGIYVDKQASNMEDIKFTNPYKRPKSNDIGSEWLDDEMNRASFIVLSGATIHPGKVDEQFAPKRKLKFEIAKVTDEGRLVDMAGAKRFVQLMQRHTHNKESDFGGRIMLVNVKATTNWLYCTKYSVHLKGFPALDKWLRDIQKGKSIEESLFASFGLFKKPHVSLCELPAYGVGKSVNHLPKHRRYEIRKKIRGLVYNWLRRLECEIAVFDIKSGSNNGPFRPTKPLACEVCDDGNKSTQGDSKEVE